MSDTIQLESFNQSLHGARILCQGPFKKVYPPILDAIQNIREPFKKKVLLTNVAFGLSVMALQYDVVFHVKDSSDWTMLLTYLVNCPKPSLLVIEDIVIPDGLWSKLTKQTTVVNFASQPVFSLRPYDAIFFAPIEDLHASQSQYTDNMCKILQSVYKANYSPKDHKEILQELRVANAGLVWTREGVCWYDPVESNGEKLSGKQLAELFGFLSGIF